MKYAVLTDFNLVTEDIKNGIIDLASNLEHLKKNVFISKGFATRQSANQIEKLNGDYRVYQDDRLNGGNGYFAVANLTPDLEQLVIKQIPDCLKHLGKPRIRLQVLKDFILFPHVDRGRKTSLFTMITDSRDIDCVFWETTKEHEFFENHLPDQNLIKEKMRFNVNQGETWLFDHDCIHGTLKKSDDIRVTLNLSYKLDIPELLKEIYK